MRPTATVKRRLAASSAQRIGADGDVPTAPDGFAQNCGKVARVQVGKVGLRLNDQVKKLFQLISGSAEEGFRMATRIFSLLACLAVVTVTSCNKPTAPPAPVAAAPVGGSEPQANPPSCSVESAREIKLGDGTELRVWNLKASGIKRLTARLLIATDGKAPPANEVEYRWQAWEPAAPAASGQLVLLVQDGKAFGVKGRRLPLLALDIVGSPSNSKTDKKMGLLLEGELHSSMTHSSYGTPLGERSVLYAQLFLPKAEATGTFSSGSDPESVAAASKDGRTVVAVTLEWAPR
jgi:hypothetical protein